LRRIIFLCLQYMCFRFKKKDAFSAPFLCKFLSSPFLFFYLPLFSLHAVNLFLAQRLFERDVSFLKSKLCELPHSACFQFFYFKFAVKTSFKPSKFKIKSELVLYRRYFRVLPESLAYLAIPIILENIIYLKIIAFLII
jgi:hypothetical protein